MKYLYTTKPDETCHEVEPGIWGRPVHTHEQPKLRKKGWVYNVNDLKEADHGLRETEEEGRKESEEVRFSEATHFFVSAGDTREELESRHAELFGKKPHGKMSDDKLKAKVQAKLDEVFGDDQG